LKIPKNMTEQQVLDQIDKVVNVIATKYAFYGFTVTDIKQEAFIICLEAIDRYDEERPLENFLSANLSNRLKNFVRDNYYSYGEVEKGKIAHPAQLENEYSILDHQNKFAINTDSIDYSEMQDIINKYLPSNMRFDYLKIINDSYVPKKRREEIINTVKYIIKENITEELLI